MLVTGAAKEGLRCGRWFAIQLLVGEFWDAESFERTRMPRSQARKPGTTMTSKAGNWLPWGEGGTLISSEAALQREQLA
ncbi:hypothetical protein TC41_2828 [Alicyclobacillus acidocaldarius subsp. acidocaldarius Tc-4-1]|uniref:Uncharacterized protein n=1 Tax=Alicyclobacillus acidocaldarius (strain Tc-4-1) TaxID=1048834 RepID=F8IJK7_ALIAT|nr:hypothetical protein TC41_2828 [Alicyclobacillus acidocaldarius subsp. acidocaldarius Tc-4-1]